MRLEWLRPWVVVLVVVMCGLLGCTDASHYRRYNDVKSLFAVLNQSVKSGMTVDQVQSFLGPGKDVQDRERLLLATRKWAERDPANFPEGVRDVDRFLGYSVDNHGVLVNLQFRDDRLVNHNPCHFEKYDIG